jgi:hypothetical protein
MNDLARTAVVSALALVLPGCGTLVGGTRQTINVSSVPDGATVRTNPITSDHVTPAQIRLERKNSYTLTFEKDGYSTGTLVIEKEMRVGVLIADIILFPIGVIVDAITGAWYSLSPDPASVSLRRQSADAEGPAEILVTLRSEKNEEGEIVVTIDSPVSVRTHVEVNR